MYTILFHLIEICKFITRAADGLLIIIELYKDEQNVSDNVFSTFLYIYTFTDDAHCASVRPTECTHISESYKITKM